MDAADRTDTSENDGRRALLADRRDVDADARESEADRRELTNDTWERTLDRWQQALVAREVEFNELDDEDERRATHDRAHRERDHVERRLDAERRRDDAIERDLDRGERVRRASDGSATVDLGASPLGSRFAAELKSAGTVAAILELIVRTGLDAVGGCDAASVVLSIDGSLDTAATTDGWAAEIDRHQISEGSGPILDAIESGMTVTSDLSADRRWPQLELHRPTNPARAAISCCLAVGADDKGALTFYSRRVNGFDPAGTRTGDMLAAHASAALERSFDRLSFQARSEAWQNALASRDLIGQAKGILMQQRHIDADQAFLELRHVSQRLNKKIRDIAEQIVKDRRLPGA